MFCQENLHFSTYCAICSSKFTEKRKSDITEEFDDAVKLYIFMICIKMFLRLIKFQNIQKCLKLKKSEIRTFYNILELTYNILKSLEWCFGLVQNFTHIIKS